MQDLGGGGGDLGARIPKMRPASCLMSRIPRVRPSGRTQLVNTLLYSISVIGGLHIPPVGSVDASGVSCSFGIPDKL